MPTIGVSLAVPEPWGSRLQEFRVANGDAQGSTIPTHITLVPPLEVDAARGSPTWSGTWRRSRPAARRTASTCAGPAPSGPVSPVVFVNLVEGISQTEQLANDCRRGPLALELELPLPPARDGGPPPRRRRASTAPSTELAGFDCAFTVDATSTSTSTTPTTGGRRPTTSP